MKAWVLIAPALFAGFLGCWQVNRYHWKVKVIREQQKAFQVLVHSCAFCLTAASDMVVNL